MLNNRLSKRAGTVAACLAAALAAPAMATATTSPLAQGHRYRHGVVPMRPGKLHNESNPAPHPATNANNLNYGGGISGVGVTTGAPKVYLVFWGSQWGTQSTNSQGYITLSGDSNNAAPLLQGFFKGLGTGSETWSGVMTQYCQGIATGAQTCPTGSAQVGYPTGGALAGVWVDESAAAPASATGHQIGVEAVAAAGHFGNTTAALNRNVQYDILSPTGTTPDGFNTANGQFCAWHDYNGDSTLTGGAVTSPYGPLAFTNMPYVTDAGSSCGENFVNSGSNGIDDGFTIVNGHEYAETITDQFPAGGWTDSSGNENGDKCAWISSGQGASQNITLTTGSFAVQSTWANDFSGGTGGCEVSHPIVGGGGGNTVTVTNPGTQTGRVGTAASLQIAASDSAGGQTLTYSATGLPAGLSINSSTGLISGTPTTAGSSSVTVTVKDTTGASGTTSFSWTISPAAGNTVTVTDPGNQSSTVGTAVSLQIQATDSASGQTLTYSATGLPKGLSISSSTGQISGTPTTAGTASVTVTVTDGTGASGSTAFSWTVNSSGGGGCTAAQLLGNPGFETGTASPWTTTSGVLNNSSSEPAHTGSWDAWLDGYGTPHTDTVSQSVTIPAGCNSNSLSFWLHIDTANTSGSAQDTLNVQLLNSSGTVLTTLATYSNLNANTGYAQKTFNVSAYAGQAITLKLTGTESGNGQTSFVLDDFALNVSGTGGGGNTVTVTNPGNQTGNVGTAASLQIGASDSASGQTLSYSASGLPAGLSINSSSGLISGTPTTAGTSSVTVTVTDGTGASGTASFTWTVNAVQNVVTVTNPGAQTGTVGTAASLQIQATDSAAKQTLTYSATGLPAGLSISSSTGLISGTPTTAGSSNVTVKATDSTGASGSTSFTWTISSSGGGGCSAAQLLGNPGFETGSASPWSASSGVINSDPTEPPHSGSWDAWLDGYGTTHTDTLSQAVTIPSTCVNAKVSFWLHIDTAETSTTTAYDTLKVQILNSSGTVLSTLATYSNLNHNTGYAQRSFSLTSYIGQKVTLKFTGSEDASLQTSFVIDDTAINVS